VGITIKGGEVVTASDRYVADVQATGGTITRIGKDLAPAAGDTVIDATGQLVFPGGIDVHTHLDMPFMGTTSSDDFDSGHRAAAAGGTTTHIDFVIPARGKSLHDGLAAWNAKAKGKASIDYTFHMCVIEWTERVAREIPEIVRAGVTSLKCFLSYKGALEVNDAELFRVFKAARDAGALVTLHCENADIVADLQRELIAAGKTAPRYHYDSRPPAVEGEGTARAIHIAGLAGCPMYVVHLTCGESLASVRRARAAGQAVWAETCVQYLVLDSDTCYASDDFEVSKYILSPPLRPAHNKDILWQALRDGSLAVVSTDHAPFNYKGQKEMGRGNFCMIPNGLPNIEERMKLLYTHGVAAGRISANRFVEITATEPAKLFGLWPRKGTIAVGSDCDLFVWNPKAKTTIRQATQLMRTDYSCFEGWEVAGAVTATVRRGEVLYQGGKFVGQPGSGKFLPRAPFDPHVYGPRGGARA